MAFFYSSLPFVCYGIYLGKSKGYLQKMMTNYSSKMQIMATIVFYVIGIVECQFIKDNIFAAIPLSISFFMLIINWGNNVKKAAPTNRHWMSISGTDSYITS